MKKEGDFDPTFTALPARRGPKGQKFTFLQNTYLVTLANARYFPLAVHFFSTCASGKGFVTDH
jgi:hypothetical protein